MLDNETQLKGLHDMHPDVTTKSILESLPNAKNKSILISIQPKWCKLIIEGKKTLEVRKNKPKLDTPFKCYIYCTAGTGKNTLNVPITREQIVKHYEETGSMIFLNSPIGNCKVIGEFICDKILPLSIEYSDPNSSVASAEFPGTCLTDKQIINYLGNGNQGYAWHISNLKIYDTPRKLVTFERPYDCDNCDATWATECNECHAENKVKHPPQSWCYVEDLSN